VPFADIEDPARLRRLLQAVLLLESDLALPALLQHIVEEACALVDARYGALGVLDPQGGLSEFLTVGIDEETRRRLGPNPEGHGVLGLLILDPRPLRLADVAQHPDSVGFPPGHPKMTSFLGVPIQARDRVFGNLYLTDKQTAPEFSEDDEQVLTALAVAAGVAIDNARLHSEVAELQLWEDRDRIARALHDEVIQRLFATALSLQGTVRLAEQAEVAKRVQGAVDDLDDTIRRIRTTIFNLEARPTDAGTPRAQLLALAVEMAEPLGFEPPVVFTGPVDSAVTDDLLTDLLPTLREALSNVARHAGASSAQVEVTVTDRVALRVTDDGAGLPASRRAGMGLANMVARAERRGGRFTAEAIPSGGTRVTWEVPLPPS